MSKKMYNWHLIYDGGGKSRWVLVPVIEIFIDHRLDPIRLKKF